MKDDEAVSWTLARVAWTLARVAELERDNAKLKRALDSIAHYVAENWTDDNVTDWNAIERVLASAGYEVVWGGDPEPFIHGDNAEGAEG